MTQDKNAEKFLELIKKSHRGKFKIYIGMSAGVGKTFRMLQEAHSLLKNGIDVKIGFVETHQRAETHALLEGLPIIPRKKIFYKGKELEEMDLQAVLNVRPQIVIVDELAHTNIPSSKNEKRWQDVDDLLEAGINVISAVNIQHLESLHEQIEHITGIDISERIPDTALQMADEVVNIDLTADELITRLKEGKIYDQAKVHTALKHFFQSDKILQLRELALKEVAQQLDTKIEKEIYSPNKLPNERVLACVSSNTEKAQKVIRKAARLTSYYDYDDNWFALYVQQKKENPNTIELSKQRHLINNFKLATELGAEVLTVEAEDIAEAIFNTAIEKGATLIVMGEPKFSVLSHFLNLDIFYKLTKKIATTDIDLLVIS
ncbi:MAG: sensor protein KdpD [Cytophagales bacterium]|nr:MAG: sensor protein KdpD [Cytophagales bacterium]